MVTDLSWKYSKATVVVATLVAMVIVLTECLNDGVVTHHFLNDPDMPGLSNWWGILLFPLYTYFLLYRIKNRKLSRLLHPARIKLLWIIAGLFYGLILTYLFRIDSIYLEYWWKGLFILGFFLPLYHEEYLLGFMLGASYTLGTILPVLIGLCLALILYLSYECPRWIFRKLINNQ